MAKGGCRLSQTYAADNKREPLDIAYSSIFTYLAQSELTWHRADLLSQEPAGLLGS